jgi:hypothetical protein
VNASAADLFEVHGFGIADNDLGHRGGLPVCYLAGSVAIAAMSV